MFVVSVIFLFFLTVCSRALPGAYVFIIHCCARVTTALRALTPFAVGVSSRSPVRNYDGFGGTVFVYRYIYICVLCACDVCA